MTLCSWLAPSGFRAHRSRPARLLLLAGAACVALSGPPALADDNDFRLALELIVFLQLDPYASTESLGVEPQSLPAPRIHPAPPLWPDSAPGTPPPPAGVIALTRTHYAMQEIWTIMRRSAEYRPLAHFAWATPVEWNGEAVSLRLSTLSAGALPFSGLVSLEEDRFVHVTLDLRLPEGPDSDKVFRLSGRRRLLLGEIHYFDHPRFGALARLFRYRDRPKTAG